MENTYSRVPFGNPPLPPKRKRKEIAAAKRKPNILNYKLNVQADSIRGRYSYNMHKFLIMFF